MHSPDPLPHTRRTRPGPARHRVRRLLADERTGGALLLVAALSSFLWANSPWAGTRAAIAGTVVGPATLHLDLTLAQWASDGLLAVFFLVVGLELSQEFVQGSLRDLRAAAVPVLAAVGGMVTPAALFVLLVHVLGEPGATHGWAVPTATDIAFALGVLALAGRGLPRGLRTFLLTLAVVDDLLAIVVIALFHTTGLAALPLVGALACVAGFALVVRARRVRIWVALPIALLAWVCLHASGVHATIAGVLLGFAVPARPLHGEWRPRAAVLGQHLSPFSTFVVLPVFAFFAAGVSLDEGAPGVGPSAVLGEPVFAAVLVALVVGKFLGVMGTTALVTALSPLRIPGGITLRDLLPVALLTGIGFTVALLMADLSFADGTHVAAAKLGILVGSILSALLGALALRWAARRRVRLCADGADFDPRTERTSR